MRYVLCPGTVISKNDGDRHYIDKQKLAELYGVTLEECVVWDEHNEDTFQTQEGDVFLSPRYDGNYKKMPRLNRARAPMGETLSEAWGIYTQHFGGKIKDPALYVIEEAFWMGATAAMGILFDIPTRGDPEAVQHERLTKLKNDAIAKLIQLRVEKHARTATGGDER